MAAEKSKDVGSFQTQQMLMLDLQADLQASQICALTAPVFIQASAQLGTSVNRTTGCRMDDYLQKPIL